MNPLVIGCFERQALKTLADRAARLPLDLARMVDDVRTDGGIQRYAAYMKRQSLDLPVDYVICFSVEVGHPAGAMRHLAVHSTSSKVLPSASMAWSIALELGFTGSVETCLLWVRDSAQGPQMAVHLAQPVAMGLPLPAVWLSGEGTLH